MNKEEKKSILQNVKQDRIRGYSLGDALIEAGIDSSTYHKWMKEVYPDYEEIVEQSREMNFYERIATTYNSNKDKIKNDDIFFAISEELGELSRAIRVEDNYVLAGHKESHSSKEEAIDVIICAIEMFVHRGGTEEQFHQLIDRKLSKWEELWRKQNESDISA